MALEAGEDSIVIVLGLMSGTSVDGVDAALTDIRRTGSHLRVKLLARDSLAYSPGLRNRILAASKKGDVSEVCHLNVVLGEVFAKAACQAIRRSGLSLQNVELIGSHGQTIHHRPFPVLEPGLGSIRSTLQIGEPAVIAERTGITTIAHFRARDLAAGGEGAPLTPYVHHLMFCHRSRSRLVVNLGGISNVTLLPGGRDVQDVRAFDTGPCNMLLDGIVESLSDGKQSMDRGGKLAKRGHIDRQLLQYLLAHPFIVRKPPKSTGREEFGQAFIRKVLMKARLKRLPPADILSTCCRFIALSVHMAQRFLTQDIAEIIVGGGGVYNPALMAELVRVFHPVPVNTMDQHGTHSKAFEAQAFAVLAYQTFHGVPTNIPAVTGARRHVILGSLVPGTRMKSP